MALWTGTYAVDNLAEVDVIAHSPCTRIVVQENYDSTHTPADDLLQRGKASSGQIRIPKGTPAVYTRQLPCLPGEKFGTIQAATTSVSVQQIETLQV